MSAGSSILLVVGDELEEVVLKDFRSVIPKRRDHLRFEDSFSPLLCCHKYS